MKREVELQERQLQMLNKQLEFQRYQKKHLSEKTLSQKGQKNSEEALKVDLESEYECVKKDCKESCLHLNTVLYEFQAKVGDENKLLKENDFLNVTDEEDCLKDYTNKERDLLRNVKDLLYQEIDIESLELIQTDSADKQSEKEKKNYDDKLRDELLVIDKCYPSLLFKYIESKIEMEIENNFCVAMNDVVVNRNAFFQFNFDEAEAASRQNPEIAGTSERKLFTLGDKQYNHIQDSIGI